MAGSSGSSFVSVELVAVLLGAVCVSVLTASALSAGVVVPLTSDTPETGPGSGLLAPAIVGIAVLALGALVATALRDGTPPPSGPRRRSGLTLDESEVRAVLERWYPDWEGRQRNRVAEAISYHRRRMGPDD